jgi:hypothetical protein
VAFGKRRFLAGAATALGLALWPITNAVAQAPPGLAGSQGACQRDLFMTRAALNQTTDRLQKTKPEPAELCRAWRFHLDTLRRASAVYGRCLTGGERSEKVGDMNSQASDFARLIGERCRGK